MRPALRSFSLVALALTARCDRPRAAPRFRATHVETAVGYAPGLGHAYGVRVANAMRPAFERLIAPALGVDSTLR